MKINTGNPLILFGLGVASVIAAGALMHYGRRLPIIKDARKGY